MHKLNFKKKRLDRCPPPHSTVPQSSRTLSPNWPPSASYFWSSAIIILFLLPSQLPNYDPLPLQFFLLSYFLSLYSPAFFLGLNFVEDNENLANDYRWINEKFSAFFVVYLDGGFSFLGDIYNMTIPDKWLPSWYVGSRLWMAVVLMVRGVRAISKREQACEGTKKWRCLGEGGRGGGAVVTCLFGGSARA